MYKQNRLIPFDYRSESIENKGEFSMQKALNIIKSIFVWGVVAIAICMMIFTVVSVNTFDRNDRKIFGYKAFIVLSDSMKKTDFAAGDLIFSKEVDPSTLKVGDIITYQSTNTDNFGGIVTHKIRELTKDGEGNPGFITYGTTTDTNDENVVTYSFVLGKYKGKLPKVGKFFQFLKTTPGYIVCIFLPFLTLILIQGANTIRLFKKYKKEQQDKIQAERDQIEAERAETQKMMAELLAMKAQMEQNIIKSETTEKKMENPSDYSSKEE